MHKHTIFLIIFLSRKRIAILMFLSIHDAKKYINGLHFLDKDMIKNIYINTMIGPKL